MIKFFVRGTPVGQPRPRAFARKMGDKFVARVYDAGTAEGWKGAIAQEAEKYRPEKPALGVVAVQIRFQFPRPRSHFGSGKNAEVIKANAPQYKLGKPDLDNLAKAVLDALTVIGGFWADDAQVARLVLSKYYDPVPGAEIMIFSDHGPDVHPSL